jgi:hypothetical protein
MAAVTAHAIAQSINNNFSAFVLAARAIANPNDDNFAATKKLLL